MLPALRVFCRRVVPPLLPALVLGAAEPVADLSQMPRVPATPATEAARTFTVRPGFRADLVASEPLLESPVALAIDEAGAAFVVEMRDYSERRSESLGRIRRLVDDDLDGRFDRATVFAEGLPWPTAVACWDGGVFVGATPDIWYLKDADGDGRAEVRERIFTGFAVESGALDPAKINVQAMLNSFQWGIDQRMHGATSMSAGKVRRIDSPFVRAWLAKSGVDPAATHPEVSLRGRDFAFDPRTLLLQPTPGGGQHGMTFDATGRKFLCSNSDHLQQIVYDDTGLSGSAEQPLPSPRASIASDGAAAPVFRRSPDEPWRVLRTRWRVAGLVPGPVEGGGRASGYFTGATGVTVYRGDAYPAEMAGDTFIADCGSNLIHRKRLQPEPDGLQLRGQRVADEAQSEFLASTDNWFRPVQFVNTPDGCLWAIDMYRETIEHPWSLPDGVKRFLDLDSGRERGRLWRLAPSGFDARKGTARARDFAGADTARLVALLDHPNGWHRETAARLLHQAMDPAVTGLLRGRLARGDATPLGRLHMAQVLAAARGLDADSLGRIIRDRDEAVRAAGIELASTHSLASSVPWGGLSKDASPRVRLAVARNLSRAAEAHRVEAVAALLESGPDLVRTLAINAIGGREMDLWNLAKGRTPEALLPLARRLGRRLDAAALQPVLRDIVGFSPRSRRLAVASGLAEGVAGAGREIRAMDSEHVLAPLWTEALKLAGDPTASKSRTLGPSSGPFVDINPDDPPARLAALRFLGFGVEADVLRVLANRIGSEPDAVQSVALESLARFRGATWAQQVSARLQSAPPWIRPRVIQLLMRRPEGRRAVMDALDHRWLKLTDLDADTMAALRRDPDPVLAIEVKRWFGEPATDRKAVVERFLPALNLRGDVARGAKVFQDRCAVCHQFKGVGQVLGPDLASVAANGPEKLMVAILDPNREVAPNFMAWRAQTKDDEEVAGVLVKEEGAVIVLRQAGGAEVSVARDRLKAFENSGRSLMPEGLEDGLDPAALADLLAYLAGGGR